MHGDDNSKGEDNYKLIIINKHSANTASNQSHNSHCINAQKETFSASSTRTNAKRKQRSQFSYLHIHVLCVVAVADLGLPAAEMSRLWAAVGAASKWAAEDGLGAAAVPAQLREQVIFIIFYFSLFCEPLKLCLKQ